MSALSDADRLVAEAQRMDDYEWALDRVTRMCASALVDAQVYRQKLLKGFGYPNEAFSRAQDYRALNIILAALQQAQAPSDSVDCPACGETVKQVASATLSLALWQHWNWTCPKRQQAQPRPGQRVDS